MPPQQCFLVPLLPGTDGVQKMSKSLGNYIGIDEPPNEIFGKTMSLPDWMIVPYFEYLTDVSDDDLEVIRGAMDDGSLNPMELKKRLAGELVGQFHDPDASREARRYFERTVQSGESPEDIPSYELPGPSDLADKRLSRVLVDAELASSASEARRLISEGAVQLDGVKLEGEAVVRQPGHAADARIGPQGRAASDGETRSSGVARARGEGTGTLEMRS